MAQRLSQGSSHVVDARRDHRARLQKAPRTVTHAEHVLLNVIDGWLDIEHGRQLRAEPGTFVVVPAGVPHRTMGGRDIDRWSVAFCPSCVRLDESQPLMAPFARVRRGALPIVKIPRARHARVRRLFADLANESGRQGPLSFELTRAHLILLLGELSRAMPAGTQSAVQSSLVGQTLEFIHRHALGKLSLQDVAAGVGRSGAYLTTMLRKATGHTVGEWIAAAKVAEAARWLTHTDDSVDEIASHVGWQDKTHLIRQFKRVYGQTPAAWRRQQRNQ